MTETVQIAFNATTAKLVNPSKETKNIVANLLSYMVQGAEMTYAFKQTGWDGRSSFFNRMQATFPAGFVHMTHSELVRQGYTVQLIKKPLPAPRGVENPIVDEFGNDDPHYDYQLKALRQVERHGAGILQIATGGGKSKVAKLIVARYRRPTLFLTTRGSLMYQMARSFEAAGYAVGYMGDGEWSPRKGINVGMVQTLVSRLEEPKLDAEMRALVTSNVKGEKGMTRPEMQKMAEARFAEKTRLRNLTVKILEMFEVVIGEEAHEAGGNSYFQILKQCKNARIRVALTATPFMRDAEDDNMRLMAAFGPILIKVSEKELIDRGILAKPYFKFIDAQPHPKLRKSSPYQRARTLGIVEGPYRNAHIIREASRAIARKLPVMILVGIKQHGAFLEKAFKARGVNARFFYGEDKQDERMAALKALGSGELQVLIGTTILDVGIDVPAVGMVILAGGGKAEVALRQRIGRGLRAKKLGPNVCFIVDFTDGANSHLRDHAKQRRKIIEDTAGFDEGILASNHDFPWSLFDAQNQAA